MCYLKQGRTLSRTFQIICCFRRYVRYQQKVKFLCATKLLSNLRLYPTTLRVVGSAIYRKVAPTFYYVTTFSDLFQSEICYMLFGFNVSLKCNLIISHLLFINDKKIIRSIY
ncbi:hypothetical protein RND81_09G087800 [Saponaria officinalis]|uniref:Uncharacterized protein n=1 Tax=Saponaria officinalis TaxID=3572 RepID=A0AAW1IJT1_SAPOF